MSNSFDIFPIDAPDKSARSPYFNDSRVVKLIDILDFQFIEYIADIISRFSSHQMFQSNFDMYESVEFQKEYNDKVYEYRSYLEGIYNGAPGDDLNNVRSAVLERLIYKFRKPRYTGEAWIEPYVYISNNKQCSSKSIDIAAWNQTMKRGECVECAVTANFIHTKTKQEELAELERIPTNFSDKISVFFVSFITTGALNQRLGTSFKLNIIGRDKLVNFCAN